MLYCRYNELKWTIIPAARKVNDEKTDVASGNRSLGSFPLRLCHRAEKRYDAGEVPRLRLRVHRTHGWMSKKE